MAKIKGKPIAKASVRFDPAKPGAKAAAAAKSLSLAKKKLGKR
jgi:hypothetical protein